jgi:hypothetical protein
MLLCYAALFAILQYIFIPDWMMKSLRLKPRDIVQLRYKVG